MILGEYDVLRPPAVVEPGVRYLCFTDEFRDVAPWQCAPFPALAGCSRSSRVPKILPHLLMDTSYSIYHDGCLQMACKPSRLVDEFLEESDVAMYRHPCRKNVFEEVEVCQRFGIGYGPEMVAQAKRYRQMGIGNELWAGGVVVRRHTDLTALFNEIWWREFAAGCGRDQFALAAARACVGLNVGEIPGNIIQDSKRFQFHFHADFTNFSDNAQHQAERKRRAERRRRLLEVIS